MKTTSIKSIKGGFSLVELLVVIAVIAIIAAIAIPNIANITQQAGVAKDQRNAQSVASVAAAAVAAGYTNTSTWSTPGGVITDLEDGVLVTNNNGNVMSFGISPLSSNERTGATSYLTASTNGTVTYDVSP